MASAKKLITENSKVARHWFVDRVRHPQRGAFDELAPGEAAVKRVGVSENLLDIGTRGSTPSGEEPTSGI